MSLLALHHRRFAALHHEVYLITTLIDGALVQIPGHAFVADAVGTVVRLAER